MRLFFKFSQYIFYFLLISLSIFETYATSNSKRDPFNFNRRDLIELNRAGLQKDMAELAYKNDKEAFNFIVDVAAFGVGNFTGKNGKGSGKRAVLAKIVEKGMQGFGHYVGRELANQRNNYKELDQYFNSKFNTYIKVLRINSAGTNFQDFMKGDSPGQLADRVEFYKFANRVVDIDSLSGEQKTIANFALLHYFNTHIIKDHAGFKIDLKSIQQNQKETSKSLKNILDGMMTNELGRKINSSINEMHAMANEQFSEVQEKLEVLFRAHMAEGDKREAQELRANFLAAFGILRIGNMLAGNNPKFQNKIVAAEHIAEIGLAIKELKAVGNFVKLANYSDVISASLGLVSFLASKNTPSFEEIVLQQLQRITELILEVREEMHARFNHLDRSIFYSYYGILDELRSQFSEVRFSLSSLHKRLNTVVGIGYRNVQMTADLNAFQKLSNLNYFEFDRYLNYRTHERWKVAKFEKFLEELTKTVNEMSRFPISQHIFRRNGKTYGFTFITDANDAGEPRLDVQQVGRSARGFAFRNPITGQKDIHALPTYDQLFVPLIGEFYQNDSDLVAHPFYLVKLAQKLQTAKELILKDQITEGEKNFVLNDKELGGLFGTFRWAEDEILSKAKNMRIALDRARDTRFIDSQGKQVSYLGLQIDAYKEQVQRIPKIFMDQYKRVLQNDVFNKLETAKADRDKLYQEIFPAIEHVTFNELLGNFRDRGMFFRQNKSNQELIELERGANLIHGKISSIYNRLNSEHDDINEGVHANFLTGKVIPSKTSNIDKDVFKKEHLILGRLKQIGPKGYRFQSVPSLDEAGFIVSSYDLENLISKYYPSFSTELTIALQLKLGRVEVELTDTGSDFGEDDFLHPSGKKGYCGKELSWAWNYFNEQGPNEVKSFYTHGWCSHYHNRSSMVDVETYEGCERGRIESKHCCNGAPQMVYTIYWVDEFDENNKKELFKFNLKHRKNKTGVMKFLYSAPLTDGRHPFGGFRRFRNHIHRDQTNYLDFLGVRYYYHLFELEYLLNNLDDECEMAVNTNMISTIREKLRIKRENFESKLAEVSNNLLGSEEQYLNKENVIMGDYIDGVITLIDNYLNHVHYNNLQDSPLINKIRVNLMSKTDWEEIFNYYLHDKGISIEEREERLAFFVKNVEDMVKKYVSYLDQAKVHFEKFNQKTREPVYHPSVEEVFRIFGHKTRKPLPISLSEDTQINIKNIIFGIPELSIW